MSRVVTLIFCLFFAHFVHADPFITYGRFPARGVATVNTGYVIGGLTPGLSTGVKTQTLGQVLGNAGNNRVTVAYRPLGSTMGIGYAPLGSVLAGGLRPTSQTTSSNSANINSNQGTSGTMTSSQSQNSWQGGAGTAGNTVGQAWANPQMNQPNGAISSNSNNQVYWPNGNSNQGGSTNGAGNTGQSQNSWQTGAGAAGSAGGQMGTNPQMGHQNGPSSVNANNQAYWANGNSNQGGTAGSGTAAQSQNSWQTGGQIAANPQMQHKNGESFSNDNNQPYWANGNSNQGGRISGSGTAAQAQNSWHTGAGAAGSVGGQIVANPQMQHQNGASSSNSNSQAHWANQATRPSFAADQNTNWQNGASAGNAGQASSNANIRPGQFGGTTANQISNGQSTPMQSGGNIGSTAQQNAPLSSAGTGSGSHNQAWQGTPTQTPSWPTKPQNGNAVQINVNGQMAAQHNSGVSVGPQLNMGASVSRPPAQNVQSDSNQNGLADRFGQREQPAQPAQNLENPSIDSWWGLGQIDDYPQSGPVYVGMA